MFTTSKKQRLLTEQDREWHLSIKKRAADPHASMRVIRINSMYLELVDGYYTNRGLMSIIGGGAIFLFGWVIASTWYSVIFDYFLNERWDGREKFGMMSSAIFGTVLFCVEAGVIVIFYRWIGEWFRYTYYPIRLNRRMRMVYVFRGDGTVLKASWDDVYFALRVNAQVAGIRTFGICGLMLKDPKTVEEMFVFGYASSSKENCLRHWEFIRRYMEEGPRAVLNAPGLDLYLPIADKRETLYQGWIQLVSHDAWNPVFKWLMFPFHVLFFIGRLVHRATSKVPKWPADVEAECRIEPGDPHVRDSSLNPPEYR
ncbi:DUF6708 domain-containing protein [Burkholderia sp. Ac-20344]|uniref:DUF6708 domain-containing protein n=1 Tax=Burkholderia sp. Ac-20344 TaxID=2703890 RepID=UPI00197B3715|nr:DUF6708 domain-containing protein [Burkholderia sp. Ac-20344]MBN3837039.1 hypothetical protein [Burkholderia sp. Ac-20344]